jgi:non-ribosomal peptide synthetase component F
MAASIGDMLEERLREQPAAIALTADGVGWTWAELGARARQIARALVASGIGPQERVVYVGKNSAELVQVLLGAALAKSSSSRSTGGSRRRSWCSRSATPGPPCSSSTARSPRSRPAFATSSRGCAR